MTARHEEGIHLVHEIHKLLICIKILSDFTPLIMDLMEYFI